MNSTLTYFNTCKHSILVMYMIGFVMDCCVGVNGWLTWCYKMV